MSATKYDSFVIEQGADFSRTLKFKDSEGAAIDLTGSTFRGQIRQVANTSELAAEFTCEVLDQETNPGEVTISLTPAETAAIELRPQRVAERQNQRFAYDLERVIGETVERLLYGTLEVSPSVYVEEEE